LKKKHHITFRFWESKISNRLAGRVKVNAIWFR